MVVTSVVMLGLGAALVTACSPPGPSPSSASNDLVGPPGGPATSGGPLAGPASGGPSPGPSGPASPPGSDGAKGRLSLRLTDSPFSDAQAVLVTFSEVRVHRSGADDGDEGEEGEGEGEGEEEEGQGGGWETVPFPDGVVSVTCDLKQLENGSIDLLGFGLLPAGHYTQIRLIVTSASIHFDSPAAGGPCAPVIAPPDAGAPVRVPSGVVRLVRQFTIQEGGTTSILLDFDGDKSIVRTGPAGPSAAAANGNGSGNGNGNGKNGNSGNGNGSGKPGSDDDEDDEDEASGGRYLLKPVIRVVSVQQAE